MDLRIGYLQGELGEIQARALVTQLDRLITGATVSAVAVESEPAQPYCEGVFASPLEVALLNCELEAFVGSLQDINVMLPEGLRLAAVTQRVDVRDAAVTADGLPLRAMPEHTQVIVDGSRRAHQIKMLRADLEPVIVNMRPEKMLASIDSGDDQAGIIAMSDLCWMRKDSRAAEILSIDEMLPGSGQGALGLVVREVDAAVAKALLVVNHRATWACVCAERALITRIGWSACAPVGVHAEAGEDDAIKLRACAFGQSEGEVACAEGTDSVENSEDLATRVAEDLMRAGGERIIREARLSTY